MAIEIGDIEREGDHKGEIYGGIWPEEYGGDNKPVWFSEPPELMNHWCAATWAWAKGQGCSLPTTKQGDYLTTLKGKGGAFTEIFNRGDSAIWLAESIDGGDYAWCQRLSVGDRKLLGKGYGLSVLTVRR
jgi:hypothetical protein